MSAPLTIDQIESAAEAAGLKVNRRTHYMQCPAHRGADLNCRIFEHGDGGTIAHCHSNGCTWPEIKAALGLDTLKRSEPTRQKRPGATQGPKPAIVATYDYEDATGKLRYQTVRLEPGKDGKAKSFYQRRPDGKGGWIDDLKGIDSLVYRLPELLASMGIVLIVEGEKDVDNLAALGFTATCNHGGAGKWSDTHAAYLAGRDVAVTPDNDDPGRSHATKVAESLYPYARSIRLVPLPGLEEKGDASDWLNQGGTADQLRAMIEATLPWERPKPEDGAALLDAVVSLLSRFVAFPSVATCHAVTLWIVHTHLMPKWDVTPRLNIYSAEKRSGKTRLLELVGLLVPNPIHTNNASVAALQRLAADGENLPTLLVDEADAIFGAKTAAMHEDLRSFLNSGWARGVDAIRCESTGRKFEVVRYSSFCAVALAGIGQLPDTITDRAIDAHMRRRAPGESVERYRRRIEEKHGHELRDQLAVWARVVEPSIGNPWPEMPYELEDRAADAWEPLLAVADAAGGDWPQRARAAAKGLAVESEEDQTENVRLLADVRAVFTTTQADALFGETIIQHLTALAEAPWAEINYGKSLNARGLSQRLKAYGVKSQTIRLGKETRRGYWRADFTDAWNRYLTSAATSETSATSATHPGNPSNHAGNPVALPENESATEVQHDDTHDTPFGNVAQQSFGSATENPSNGADVAHVAHVADVPAKRDTGDAFAQRIQEMPTGELTDQERTALNGKPEPGPSTRTADDTRRCVDCGEPVQMRRLDHCDECVQVRYERKYGALAAVQLEPMFAAGEPGLDRYTS